MNDLDELLEKINEVEEKEREDASASAITGGGGKMKKGKKTLKQEAMPSPHGIRIQPKIPAELRTKAAKAAASKDRKGQKAVVKKLDNDLEEDKDEFDMMVTDKAANRRLSDKLGFTPEKKVKKEPKASPKKAQKSKKNPWESGSEISTDDEDNEDMEVEKKERDNVRRNAATNKYKDYMSGSSGSDSDDIMEEKTNGVNGNGNGKLVRFLRENFFVNNRKKKIFFFYISRILLMTKTLTAFSNQVLMTNQVPNENLTYLTTMMKTTQKMISKRTTLTHLLSRILPKLPKRPKL